MKRKPVVAGTFYPVDKNNLREELENCVRHAAKKKKVIGLISPHAGYIYSGACAGKGFGAVDLPGRIIILGVNHHGFGQPYAVDGNDAWETPLGDIPVDQELRQHLTQNSDIFKVDSMASSREHSLEVQVPFIKYLKPDAKILPITLASGDADRLLEGGREIGRLVRDYPDTLMVASTDMSHYISAENAALKDQKAMDQIQQLNPRGLLQVVEDERISMCGSAPTAMMLAAALEKGATKTELIEYTNSGEISGDFAQVVGYLSMLVL